MRKLKYALLGLGLVLIGIVFSTQWAYIMDLFPERMNKSNLPISAVEWTSRPEQNRISKLDSQTILFWVRRAVGDIYNVSYQDYFPRFEHSASYFSERGWDTFRQSLDASNRIPMLKSRQARMHVELSPDAGRLRVDKVSKQFFVELPVVVNWREGTKTTKDNRLLSINLELIEGESPMIFIQQINERNYVS